MAIELDAPLAQSIKTTKRSKKDSSRNMESTKLKSQVVKVENKARHPCRIQSPEPPRRSSYQGKQRDNRFKPDSRRSFGDQGVRRVSGTGVQKPYGAGRPFHGRKPYEGPIETRTSYGGRRSLESRLSFDGRKPAGRRSEDRFVRQPFNRNSESRRPFRSVQGPKAPKKEARPQKTMEELDAELDAYMTRDN